MRTCLRSRRGRTGAACALFVVLVRAPIATADSSDRLLLSGNAETLTDTNGGGGVTVGWLHNFDPSTLLEIGAEHQVISNAHWSVGSLDGSLTLGGTGTRCTLYGDVREGAGDVGSSAFRYSVVDLGAITTWTRGWSVQAEDRQIDVQTTHGNLPKLGLLYLWDRRWLASAAYSYSVGGNLGTRLTTASVQETGTAFNPILGVAFGRASPAVIDLQTGVVLAPGQTLKEGYIGFSMPVHPWHGDITVIADYVELDSSRRATLTVNYMRQLGR
jgi:hypothetical protein